MPSTDLSGTRDHVELHKDGSVRGRGKVLQGKQDGYWEWFRRDGTRLRSGWFEAGRQVGVWTTYNSAGEVHKTTAMGDGPRADQPAASKH